MKRPLSDNPSASPRSEAYPIELFNDFVVNPVVDPHCGAMNDEDSSGFRSHNHLRAHRRFKSGAYTTEVIGVLWDM